MTSRTVGQTGRADQVIANQYFALLFLIRRCGPFRIEYFTQGADKLLGMPVATQAPTHRERFGAIGERH